MYLFNIFFSFLLNMLTGFSKIYFDLAIVFFIRFYNALKAENKLLGLRRQFHSFLFLEFSELMCFKLKEVNLLDNK